MYDFTCDLINGKKCQAALTMLAVDLFVFALFSL